MRSRTTKHFRQLLGKLPLHIQKEAVIAYKQFRIDPDHPGLNFKPIKGQPNMFSARVTEDYRVIGKRVAPDVIVWEFIGTHTDYIRYIVRRGSGD